EVAVYRYVTEGSFDAYMWQALETKARFIAQVITGDNAARRAEDIGGQELSYAEVKAIASGNPAVLTLAEADAELQRLNFLKKNHLDAPWKPAEVEQREGRILRQGNANEEVAIYRYVTEGSFDAYMWQALETKARFISQVITGNNAARRAEDIGGQELSYAEVKAIASGNPAVLTLAEADAELQRLNLLKKNHLDEQLCGYLHNCSYGELIVMETWLIVPRWRWTIPLFPAT
ncbi:MAG: hypothetical protein ACHQ50_15705, partial [Fimbriimonadales bacterium]